MARVTSRNVAVCSGVHTGRGAGGSSTQCAGLRSMRPRRIAPMLRDSGRFGPAVPVALDASAQDKLMAFIGRDPDLAALLARYRETTTSSARSVGHSDRRPESRTWTATAEEIVANVRMADA